MGHNSRKIFKDFFNGLDQKKEVIFFGNFDNHSFDITYRLLYLNIKHNFVLYEKDLCLTIVDVKTINGFLDIRKYLHSSLYHLDIY